MSGPTYHGYPQHPHAHGSRPWWRTIGDAWVRTDLGRVAPIVTRPWAAKHAAKDIAATDDLLAAYDREHPLPPPPPLCGQVWVDLDEPKAVGAMTIAAVGPFVAVLQLSGCVSGPLLRRGIVRHQGIRYVEEAPEHVCEVFPDVDWPPAGAVLVAGPFAPWADTSEVKP